MNFDHPIFQGRGAFLLRWLGISQNTGAYTTFLSCLFPDSVAGRILLGRDDDEVTSSCYDDAGHLLEALPRQPSETWNERIHEGFCAGWRASTGFDGLEPEAPLDPLERLERREQSDEIAYLLSMLRPRTRIVVAKYFGLLEQLARPYHEIAIDEECSVERIRQIVQRALREFRWRFKSKTLKLHFLDNRPKMPISYRMQHHASVMTQFGREVHKNWSSLPSSILVRELLPRLQMLLDRLSIGASLASAAPSFRSWMQEGVEWGEAQWRDGTIVLTLRREGHAFLRHDGHESTVYRLDAEMSGLPGGTTLRLTGALGCFEFFRSVGVNTEVVDDAWGELCDPTGYWEAKRRLQKPRKERKRVRDRRREYDAGRAASSTIADAWDPFYQN